MSKTKFIYKYESVFDHNITEEEWECLDMGFDFSEKEEYLENVVILPTMGYGDICSLYKLRHDEEMAKKYEYSPDAEKFNYWDILE